MPCIANGIVVVINEDRGFAFLAPVLTDSDVNIFGDKKVFLHAFQVSEYGSDISKVELGQHVDFEYRMTEKGPRVTRVRNLGSVDKDFLNQRRSREVEPKFGPVIATAKLVTPRFSFFFNPDPEYYGKDIFASVGKLAESGFGNLREGDKALITYGTCNKKDGSPSFRITSIEEVPVIGISENVVDDREMESVTELVAKRKGVAKAKSTKKPVTKKVAKKAKPKVNGAEDPDVVATA